MQSRFAFAALGLALVALPSSGCLVAAAGAGAAGAAYVMGSLDASLPSNPERIVEASRGVLQDSDIHVLESDATTIDGTVVGRTALDRRVEITVKRVDDRQSRISIRVGTFGDRDVSQDLLDRIRARVT
jgi:uncharacterized protein DUF3568